MTAQTLPFDHLPEIDADDAPARPEKSAQAFRTISEVAEELDVPAHVLRFWETKFSAVAPLKRGGGRRYYRPSDVALLRGVRRLLYEQGLTIKGLQKLMRERGAKHISACGETGAAVVIEDADAAESVEHPAAPSALELGAIIARLEAVRDRLRA